MGLLKRSIYILTVVLCSFAWGNGGTDETHGGDIVVLEFKDLLAQLKVSVQTIPAQELPLQDFALLFAEKSEEVIVRSEERVFIAGHEVNAINYPKRIPPEIVISRSLWKYDESRRSEYRTLVIHEMMYLIGLNDDGFKYSKDLYRLILLYEEKSLRNIFRNYIVDTKNSLREQAFRRIQRGDTIITSHIELLYNLALWATLESREESQILTRMALRVARAAPEHIFMVPKAGCSIDPLNTLNWPEAQELLRFLKQKNVNRPSSFYCDSLKY